MQRSSFGSLSSSSLIADFKVLTLGQFVSYLFMLFILHLPRLDVSAVFAGGIAGFLDLFFESSMFFAGSLDTAGGLHKGYARVPAAGDRRCALLPLGIPDTQAVAARG